MQKYVRNILLTLAATVVVLFQNFSSTSTIQNIKIIDASRGDATGIPFTYAYGPSMILENDGSIHTFSCTTGIGNLGITNWDAIRHSVSYDNGRTWSIPNVVLKVTDPVNERAACDPSVVYMSSSQGKFYYMYYSGNKLNTQTSIFVARSTTINGPYLKYTLRGTWEANPPDPKIVISPRNPASENAGVYGAGQQSVVFKDNKLFIWHNDTSGILGQNNDRIYFQVSSSPTALTRGVATNVSLNDLSANSVDVKWDPVTNQFAMYSISMGHYQNSKIVVRYSKDGLTWSSPQLICDENCTPDFINNIGVLGTKIGYLLPGRYFAYGAPYDLRKDCNVYGQKLDKYCWGSWDLFGGYFSDLTRPGGEIKGYVDNVAKTSTGFLVTGWACAAATNKSIPIHIYLKNSTKSVGVAVGNANLASELGVANACSNSFRYHRYRVLIPASVAIAHPKTSVHVYGISPFGLNNNGLINSGKFVPVP